MVPGKGKGESSRALYWLDESALWFFAAGTDAVAREGWVAERGGKKEGKREREVWAR